MRLSPPSKCDCQVPDLHEVNWPEVAFTECRRCLAIQVKFNASPESFTRIQRSRRMEVGDVARCVAGVLSGVGAVALAVWIGGMP